jgi:hypothetical protein
MLIAQALGEYVTLSALNAMYTEATVRLEQTVGSWGTEGAVFLAIVCFVFWKLIAGHR